MAQQCQGVTRENKRCAMRHRTKQQGGGKYQYTERRPLRREERPQLSDEHFLIQRDQTWRLRRQDIRKLLNSMKSPNVADRIQKLPERILTDAWQQAMDTFNAENAVFNMYIFFAPCPDPAYRYLICATGSETVDDLLQQAQRLYR